MNGLYELVRNGNKDALGRIGRARGRTGDSLGGGESATGGPGQGVVKGRSCEMEWHTTEDRRTCWCAPCSAPEQCAK